DLLALVGNGEPTFLANRAPFQFLSGTLSFPPAYYQALAWFAPVWLGSSGKLDLLAFTRAGQFAAFEKEGPASHWLEVKLDGFKSNKQGIGTVVELKSGNFYKKVEVTSGPVRVSTGDLAKLDVVRVT
ncbi:MAG: hypothetical protein DMG26_18765, partial [Acidobacteria bacterium]